VIRDVTPARLLVRWLRRVTARVRELRALALTGADAGSEAWEPPGAGTVAIRRVLRDGSVTEERGLAPFVAECRVALIPWAEPGTARARIVREDE